MIICPKKIEKNGIYSRAQRDSGGNSNSNSNSNTYTITVGIAR